MHVEIVGGGPRIVLVHGSVAPGWMTWNAQRAARLAVHARRARQERLPAESAPPSDRLRAASRRAPRPARARRPSRRAHSYGAVVSLLAAPEAPLASLTVVEPPAFDVARGHDEVEEFLSRFDGRTPSDPRAYLEFFLPLVGSSLRLSDPLPPALEAGARAAMAERSPHEAVIPFDALAATVFPKLVVSGGHSAAFDAVCDVLQQRLGAQRAALPGAGHSVPRLGEPRPR